MSLTLFGASLGFSYLGRDLKGCDIELLKKVLPAFKDEPGQSRNVLTADSDRLVELYGVIAGFFNVLFIHPSSFVYDQMPAVELTV